MARQSAPGQPLIILEKVKVGWGGGIRTPNIALIY